ncbi:ATP-binding protein [Castellaniella sp.]|uniref:ATP-binding protein n=1 Tax=Castellaniella sp. TaxID=1955812 RepID=UPI002D802AAD|nr:ATP-binding protein [Castellaniella sp.]HET8703368.1 ATP-binding protein [Castellaniella sp.]
MSGAEVFLGREASGDGSHVAGRQNLRLLVQLRWIAVLGQVLAIVVAVSGFSLALPLSDMATVVVLLIVYNFFSQLRLKWHLPVSQVELFLALLVDVMALTAQLYLSGGVTNPFIFLYLLQVALAAVLLRRRTTWMMAGVTSAAFAGLVLTRHHGYTLPLDLGGGLDSPFVLGMLVCYALNAALLAIFITRIMHNVRTRDARLAALRQRASEEEHIVHMGLLASGAAHELGTPLATLDVILGDWTHASAVTADPELLQDVRDMQAQVQRCKTILSGILMSAGEMRGEALSRTTVTAFLDGLVAQWRQAHPGARLRYSRTIDSDEVVIADQGLRQMVFNVLNNALEASPTLQQFTAVLENGQLTLEIRDQGPGFVQDVLRSLGKPYRTTKGQPGRGLGLFLSHKVARSLSGTLSANNLPEGGACVTIRFPLSALTPEDADEPAE